MHWDNQPAFTEHFPELAVSANIFENDGSIATCGGGAAGTDMMLSAIETHHGHGLAQLVTDMYVHGTKRQADVGQQSPIATAINSRNQQLIKLVRHMYDNIEEPLSFDELTVLAGFQNARWNGCFNATLVYHLRNITEILAWVMGVI